ncbi:hypothetical protein HWV62_19659 [Athelia sp. TMB]|nr:hypothetical protein HWV62_19659 [Athelia sp. TMB]
MARDAIILSESDEESKTAKGKSAKDPKVIVQDEPSEGENADEDGDEEEEEYEIEQIMDSQRASKGKFRYFVKWKGYDDSHNSWVEEDDAGNAVDLITTYWRLTKGKKPAGGRKSAASASGVSEKGSESSASAVKKRGRSSAKQESDVEEVSDGDRKKARKSNGSAAKSVKKSGSIAPMDVDAPSETEHMFDMSKYSKHQSWEKLVKSVDTVERDEKGDLMLLQFYESHLRWKQVDAADA